MESSTRTNLVQNVTSPGGAEKPVVFTAAQGKALDETRARLNFSSEEIEQFAERQRKLQAAFERMAAGTLEEQQRIGDQLWAEQVERPRATRRIQAARRPRLAAVIVPRARAREQRPAGTRRTSSSSRTSSTDPGDDPDPDSDPFATLHPLPATRGQLALWFEPRIGGRR